MRETAHFNLQDFGKDGQARLTDAKVLCVGAGGLACGALPYLAGMGVGMIGVIDPDHVEESNLARQIIFVPDDVGKLKAEVAAEKLMQQNPNVQVKHYSVVLTADNALELMRDYDVVLDTTDNFAAKYLINAACLKLGKPWVYGAALEWQGQISSFVPGVTACYQCWMPDASALPAQSCSTAGVLGVLPGIIGTWQALEVVKLILDLPALRNTVRLFDAHSGRVQDLQLTLRANCICQQQPTDVALPQTINVCAGDTIRTLSWQEAKTQFPDALYIDVREPGEFAQGHVPDALNWPLSRLRAGEYLELPTDRPIILYCQRGKRSVEASHILNNEKLYSIATGFIDFY